MDCLFRAAPGKFSRSETAIIVDAVKAYAEANDISVEVSSAHLNVRYCVNSRPVAILPLLSFAALVTKVWGMVSRT